MIGPRGGQHMSKLLYIIFLRKLADLIESGAIDFPSDLFKEAVASGAIEITDYRKGVAE